MQMPVRIRNRRRIDLRVRRPASHIVRLSPLDIYHAINHRVRDVDTLGSKLSPEGLSKGALGEFAGCKTAEEGGAFD